MRTTLYILGGILLGCLLTIAGIRFLPGRYLVPFDLATSTAFRSLDKSLPLPPRALPTLNNFTTTTTVDPFHPNDGSNGIDGNTVMVGDFMGYYTTYTKIFEGEDGGSSGNITCDAFTVLRGPTKLVKYFSDMYDQGNRVNSKDEAGHLILNLNLIQTSSSNQEKIKSSSSAQPVTIILEKMVQIPREASPCATFFQIVGTR